MNVSDMQEHQEVLLKCDEEQVLEENEQPDFTSGFLCADEE